MSIILLSALLTVSLLVPVSHAQTRDEKVLNDRDRLLNDNVWYYDDLDAAIEVAAETQKPLMVVLRCIP